MDIKPYLLEKSDSLVDLMEELEIAVGNNDETESTAVVKKLNDLGNELVELILNLEDDDKAYAYFMLGSLCSALRMWPEAEDAYLHALESWSDHVGILNELFVSQYETGKYAEAKETVQKSIQYGGETPEMIHNLAAATWQLGNKAEAKLLLFNAMAKYPKERIIFELMNDFDEAEKN
jgi:tetratricopeptide (TPR) repeat protein